MSRAAGVRRLRLAALSSFTAAVAFLAAPGPGPAWAQSPSTGAIEGVIRDAQGRPLNSVAVTVISRSSGRRQIVRTDRGGQYAALSLVPGGYDVLVERLGFQPERIEGVVVSAGETRTLTVEVEPVGEQEVRLRTRAAPAALSSVTGMVPSRWFIDNGEAAGLPQETSDLAGLAALSTKAGARLDIEGMPAGTHALSIDGLPLASRPRAWGTYTKLTALPLSFFEMAGLASGSADVEYPGQAGALFSAHTRRSGPALSARAHADFGADALTFAPDDVASFQSWRVGGTVSGPMARDTAGFVVGLDYSKMQTPFASLWVPDPATDALVSAASSRDVDLAPYTGPGLAEVERIAGYGRLDARLGDVHRISVRALGASLPTLVPFHAWTESPAAWRGNPQAREFFASILLNSALSEHVTNEASLGYERSETSRQDPVSATADPPETTVAALGRTFGSLERRNVDMEVWSITGRETLQIRTSEHLLKLGVAVLLPSYDMPWFYARSGEYLFSGPDQLRTGAGVFRQVWGDDKVRADFSTRRITVYGQDTWRPRPGVEISAGARVSTFRSIDSATVNLSPEWYRLSALRNDTLESQYVVLEPRFALTMTPGGGSGLTFRTSVSVDADAPDPGVLAEVVGNWGVLGARRYSKTLPWPAEPAAPAGSDVIPTLTMLGPEFEGARTTRLQASLSGAVGGGAAISVAASVRRTDHLPRRKDLNLLPTVPASDQFGRPVYGQLVKNGSLLLAEPLSNRRFVEFEQAWGIEATGESRYFGLTVSAERPFANGFGAYLAYTWSRTEDDWLTGNPRDPLTQLDPFPFGSNLEWRDGRSDFDVPHRALAGLEVKAPGRIAPRLTALYRFQSGYPFTPGFRNGVDANGDGSAVNDVAWVDNGIAGTSELTAKWPCLQSGGFAERNACRGPDLHSLDARLSMELGLAGTTRVTVVVDAVNLIATEDGVVDRALYLVDAAAPLGVSADGRTYTVPLVANPGFGTLLTRYTPQRFLRLGLRVGF